MPYTRCRTDNGKVHSAYTTKRAAQKMARALNSSNRRLERDGYIPEPVHYIVDVLTIRDDRPEEGIGEDSPWAYCDPDFNSTWAVIAATR